MPTNELTPQQRAAIIVVRLCAGEALDIRQIMAITGLRQRGAYRLMMVLTAVHELPLYCDKGRWQLLQIAQPVQPTVLQ